MVYPRLKAIHGALRRRNPSLEVYSVSSDTFPNLEYLHEAIEHTWQNRLGAIPHLLVNTLLTTTLSRLRTLRLRMSNDMDLRAEQVPSLEYVSYYRYSRFLDDISGTVIARQFSQLLQIKSLQFLRFHDRIPPIQLNTHLDVECLDLRHLDLGFIILPLYNVVRLFRRLTCLHTAAFAVYNQWQPNDFTIDDDEAISNSVERLIMYIIEPTHTSPTDIVPSVEIMTRLPKLHKLYLQPGVESASAVFNRMKEIERFSWSAEVAERVEIDIFDNY
ncbi:hypothetical protein GGI05_003540 [Coemansia sp. RSA 2603]|nr:hypothetical protein GGI05_003540 [Coemansia sp. RSA 2603]